MIPSGRFKLPLTKRRIRIVLLLVAWGVVFFGGSLPTWRASYRNDGKIRAASDRLGSLSRMSVAGLWFDAALERWEPELRKEYDCLFPAAKQREELFLEIARVANGCGIDPFVLREIPIVFDGDPEQRSEDDESAAAGDEEIGVLMQQFAMDMSRIPSAELYRFRLQANFNTDYEHMVKFIKGLQSIPRALTVHNLAAEPDPEGLSVAMELDFYAQSRN